MTTQYFSLRSNMKQILMSSFLILKSIYRFVFIFSDSLKIASYFAGSFGCYLTKASRSYLRNNNHINTSIRSFGFVVSMAPKKVCIVEEDIKMTKDEIGDSRKKASYPRLFKNKLVKKCLKSASPGNLAVPDSA